jgi:heme exporter protein D
MMQLAVDAVAVFPAEWATVGIRLLSLLVVIVSAILALPQIRKTQSGTAARPARICCSKS